VKPFTYAMAMDQAGSPASIVPDLPLEFQTPTGLYKPENYDGRSYGPITWRLALGNSFNLSAVRVLQSAGGEKRLAKLLTSLGISTLTQEPEHYGLGLTIGNAPVRLLELTQAYSCLARMGWSQSWTLLADSVPQPAERIFSESTAWLISDILSDNAARVITFGQNSVLRLPFRAAVKTGTSTNYRDNWCLGYVPEFTVGVWAGNFQGQPMQDVSGVTGAGPIWRDVMLKLKSQHQITWFKEPLGLERGRIDLRTGKRLTLQQGPVKHSRTEIWKKDQAPPQAARSDYETRTQRAILPPIYASWIKSPDNWLGDSVTTDESARFQPLSITAPTDGLVILDGTRLLLETLPADGVQWISDTVKIELDQGRAWAVNLRKGKHVLVARRGEARAKVSFEVK
jgi:penicillin-binding protein 1C